MQRLWTTLVPMQESRPWLLVKPHAAGRCVSRQPGRVHALLIHRVMILRAGSLLLFALLFPHGCVDPGSNRPSPLKYRATGDAPEKIALYEAWWGHPQHMSVGYSSHDPAQLARQMQQARSMGISAFVVDWYGDREPFIDASYA